MTFRLFLERLRPLRCPRDGVATMPRWAKLEPTGVLLGYRCPCGYAWIEPAPADVYAAIS